MQLDDFDYTLPEDRIALFPAPTREEARLLHLSEDGVPQDRRFSEIGALFSADDVLVLNDTKVFPAFLRGHRPSRDVGGGQGAAIDLTLLAPLPNEDGSVRWRAFARPAKRLAVGDRIELTDDFGADVVSRDGAEVVLRFPGSLDDVMAAIECLGQMPLPPYIARRRAADDRDRERYQTVFADRMGSVAAPTAGLHFTEELLGVLERKGVTIVRVTLHVGPGTFLPVTATDVSSHTMHAEWGEVSDTAATTLSGALSAGARVTAVGTTALRMIETAATGPRQIGPFQGETSLFITPGFDFRIVDRLITNFHLPRSTLLMLVAAFSGRERILSAYDHAIAAGYRFYSYGDACLLERAS